MKNLLTFTAIIEFITGLLLVILPSQITTLLLGSTIDSPVALTIARVAGIALLALGIACWIARNDNQSNAVKGLIVALIVYNVGVTAVLVYAGTGLELLGIGLWPVTIAHVVMAIWSVFLWVALRKNTALKIN